MEKSKTNKGLVVMVVILSLALIGAIGYICYDKFFTVEKEDSVVDNKNNIKQNNEFYSVSNLIKNKYIEAIATTETRLYDDQNLDDMSNPYLMQIKDGKLYSTDKIMTDGKSKSELTEATEVVGTVKTVYLMMGQSVSTAQFFALTEEGDLYYSTVLKADDNSEFVSMKNFEKINHEKIKNIYKYYSDENIHNPYKALSILAELENGSLMVIENGEITQSFETAFPYVDKIYSGGGADETWWGLDISADRYLYTSQGEQIKYKDSLIKVKDGFAITDSSTVDSEEQTSNYYIIAEDNSLYEIVAGIIPIKIKSIKLYTDSKVKNYKYSNEENKDIKLEFEDGSTKEFKETSGFSTLYYRYYK